MPKGPNIAESSDEGCSHNPESYNDGDIPPVSVGVLQTMSQITKEILMKELMRASRNIDFDSDSSGTDWV